MTAGDESRERVSEAPARAEPRTARRGERPATAAGGRVTADQALRLAAVEDLVQQMLAAG